MAHSPTAEQLFVLEQYLTGEDLVIEAGAGTGKTSTLRLLAEKAREKSGLYLAFNKAIADEAKMKFKGTNIAASTSHALAFRSLDPKMRDRLSLPFPKPRERAERFNIVSYSFAKGDTAVIQRPLNAYTMTRAAAATMSSFMNSSDEAITDKHAQIPPIAVTEKGRQRLAAQLVDYATRMWEDQIDPDGEERIEHDTYLKMFQLSKPTLDADVIFLDEAQDSSPVVLDIVRQQGHAQKVLVGDRAQNIYSFRGTENAMDALPEARRASLTKSFRFGPAVADEANRLLSLQGLDMRLTGFDEIDSTVGRVSQPDAVLVRSNGGAIMELMRAQESGLRVYLAGRNRAKELLKLAKASQDLMDRGFTPHPEFALMKSWSEVVEFSETEEGRTYAPLVKVLDRFGPAEVIHAIERCTDRPEGADVAIATAHMAKGLEWDQVRIGDDFPQPKFDDDGVELPNDEELRLAYVAVTRAQVRLDLGSLNWIHWPLDHRLAEQASHAAGASRKAPKIDMRAGEIQDEIRRIAPLLAEMRGR